MGSIVPFPGASFIIKDLTADESRLVRLRRMARAMRQTMLEAIYFSESDMLRRRLRGALLVLDMLHDEELQDIELGA